MEALGRDARVYRAQQCGISTSFPGSLFSPFQERPWERGYSASCAVHVTTQEGTSNFFSFFFLIFFFHFLRKKRQQFLTASWFDIECQDCHNICVRVYLPDCFFRQFLWLAGSMEKIFQQCIEPLHRQHGCCRSDNDHHSYAIPSQFPLPQ